MILLDTNVVIAVLKRTSVSVRKRLSAAVIGERKVCISSIVVFELAFGAGRSNREEYNRSRLADFLSGDIETLQFDDEDALIAGSLRAKLANAGTPIGPYDILIAGQALRHGATLVTANAREFARVPGLKVEDWAK